MIRLAHDPVMPNEEPDFLFFDEAKKHMVEGDFIAIYKNNERILTVVFNSEVGDHKLVNEFGPDLTYNEGLKVIEIQERISKYRRESSEINVVSISDGLLSVHTPFDQSFAKDHTANLMETVNTLHGFKPKFLLGDHFYELIYLNIYRLRVINPGKSNEDCKLCYLNGDEMETLMPTHHLDTVLSGDDDFAECLLDAGQGNLMAYGINGTCAIQGKNPQKTLSIESGVVYYSATNEIRRKLSDLIAEISIVEGVKPGVLFTHDSAVFTYGPDITAIMFNPNTQEEKCVLISDNNHLSDVDRYEMLRVLENLLRFDQT